MTMATSLNPKKLKAILTSLREAITSLEKNDSPSSSSSPSSSLAIAFRLLLVSELASRGLGIDLPKNHHDTNNQDKSKNNVEWITTLLESIGSVAGKMAIDDHVKNNSSGYPVPMMAALNAASGMAASACCSSFHDDDEYDGDYSDVSLLPMDVNSIREAVIDTMKRCREVNDGRFYALLKLARDVHSENQGSSDGSSSFQASSSVEKRRERMQRHVNQWKHHFVTIAYSNYLYGATNFAKDQPPMWKRCLDAALENTRLVANSSNSSMVRGVGGSSSSSNAINYKSYQNSQTILPLQSMIRIAKSKGNEKRVKELSLMLSLGYLGGVRERMVDPADNNKGDEKGKHDDNNKVPKLDKLSTQQLLQQYYLRRTSTLVEMEDEFSNQTFLESAKTSLAFCDLPGVVNSENFESWLLYHYVQFQIEHLAEESVIWMEVQRKHQAMLNRRPEGGSGNSKNNNNSGGGNLGGIGNIGSKKSISISSTTKSIGGKAMAVQSTLATTREQIEHLTRSQMCLDMWNTWEMDSSSELASLSPLALRDAVTIALSSVSVPTTKDIVQDCYDSLLHQVERLVAVAAAVAQEHTKGKKGGRTSNDVYCVWEAVLCFVSPLMVGHLHSFATADGNDGSVTSLNTKLRRLMERCSEAILSASWFCEPIASCHYDNQGNEKVGNGTYYDFNNVSQLLNMAHTCLTACQKERLVEEKRTSEAKKKEKSVLSSQHGISVAEKKELLQFQCALASSKCRMDLQNAFKNKREDDDQSSSEISLDALIAAARRATIAAATAPSKVSSDMKSSTCLLPANANAMFGTPYLLFLNAWSGMYHSPWPFCTLGQARTIVRNARDAQSAAGKAWGRDASSMVERVMLDVGEADLEGGFMGGFKDISEKLYSRAIDTLEEKEGDIGVMGDHIKGMVKVHCLLGMANLSLPNDSSLENTVADVASAEKLARDALHILSSLDPGTEHNVQPVLILCIYPWSTPSLHRLSRSYHVCASRQLVAEACLRSSRPEDARVFLTDAVKDLPGNYEAAFALAAFHLRIMLGNNGNDGNGAKKTRTLLLKAAKMGIDTVAKPDPFALLGVWYESQKDSSRAKGCYQKALAIDPSHPVAGRGLGRLLTTSLEEERQLQTFCENAAKQNSPLNGWAWRVMGQRNSRGEEGGDDAAVVVCFQQALRCRDIQVPGNDILGPFYSDPASVSAVSNKEQCSEVSETWAELAACYRRMGKYSAAMRAYEASYCVSDGNLSPGALCAWAQVDLDLGLYEEATEKCDKVLLCLESSPEIHRMAAYIESEALLFLARRYIQEGKFGSCLSHLEKGIARLLALPLNEKLSADSYYCEVKLLGDLYSSGNSLPSYVFATASPSQDKEHERKMGHLAVEVENQISFMMKGERAYTLALEFGKNEDENEDDNKCLIAAALTDLGSNLLSQARVVSTALGEGSGGGTNTALSDLTSQSCLIKDLITRSINAYLSAVDTSPLEATAWCGLGCALIAADPLLSQHAFSRALQIDPSLADSWSHISLLYADFDTKKCSEILDYLTQVEDTPLMWIGRGFLLEKTSREWKDKDLAREGCLTKAADAYRAALQIMQHPAALLGLSLTCRRADPGLRNSNNLVYSSLADHASKLESRMSMLIHQNLTGDGNIGASYVSGLTQLEEVLNGHVGFGGLDLATEANAALSRARTYSNNEKESERDMAPCEIDLSIRLSLRLDRTAEFPYELMKNAKEKALSISPSQCPVEITDLRNPCNELDEARNSVLLNPESGEVWLIFAKMLAQELSVEAKDNTMLSSAIAAAKKAYGLFRERVVNATLLTPRRQASQVKSIEYSDKSVVSSLPPACLFSESMSLISMLEEIEALNNGGKPSVSERSFISLQECLLLDPSNPFAAASIALKTH